LGLLLQYLLRNGLLVISGTEGLYSMTPFTFAAFWVVVGAAFGLLVVGVGTLLVAGTGTQQKRDRSDDA